MKQFAPLLAAAFVLAGCATRPPEPPAQADEARKLLDGALQRAHTLPSSTSSADARPEALRLQEPRFTLNFAGEGRTLLRQVAAARGLRFNVLGPRPHLPLFVIVDVRDATLAELLRDVGAQFGQRAAVTQTDSAIEVRYRGE